jgi:hypothetical protein
MRAPRPSPALAVACLALVVASAQPVSAAVSALVPTNSVGTAQLKDGAVTTPKLHDGAVTARKIALGTVTGARIANGTVGLVDLAASAQPKPPKVLSAAGDVVDLPGTGTPATLLTISLPAGTWLLVGKTVATLTSNQSGGETIGCHLFAADDLLDFSDLYSFPGASNAFSDGAIPLQAVVTLGVPTDVTLRCFESNDDKNGSVRASKLAAIQVTP